MVEPIIRTAAQMAEKLEGIFFRMHPNKEMPAFTGSDIISDYTS
jgi:hypothetical protein